MPKPILFVTGMFRSGTTLMARLLNAHPDIAFASDPLFEVFKAFRNAVARGLADGSDVDEGAPLDDYYYFPSKLRLFRAIQASDLDLAFPADRLDALRQRVADASRQFSPRMGHSIGDLAGDTFAGLIETGLGIVHRAYGPDASVVGFKEVWTDEFAGHLLRRFPEARVVHVVRDPRAVCASKNTGDEQYPWLFLLRQWRKIAALAYLNGAEDGPFAGRVHVLRYEDLIREPEAEVAKLCDFAGVEFDARLLDPGSFVDGSGKPWEQNSSHFSGVRAFNEKSIDKWRDLLTAREVEAIERVCLPEMNLFGYVPERADGWHLPLDFVLDPLMTDEARTAQWIRRYSLFEAEPLVRDFALEHARIEAIWNDGAATDSEKEALCLLPRLYDALQGVKGTG